MKFPRCRHRRCPNPGLGVPPLCARHYREAYGIEEAEDTDPVQEIFDFLLQQPRVQHAVQQATAKFHDLQELIEHFGLKQLEQFQQLKAHQSPHYQGPGRGFASTTDPGRHPGAKQKRRQRRAPTKQEDPRIVLGFPPGQALTADEIKKRRRELARILHSDQGGNDESMKRLNAAAEALLAQL
jgi:hypothetical protein